MNTENNRNAPISLVYFSPEPDRQGHASYTHVHEIVNNLRLLGWRVMLASPKHSGALPGIVRRLFGIGWAQLRAIFAGRPDVYYLRWHFAAFPLSLWAKLARIPVVVEVNGPATDLFIAWPWTAKMRPLFSWLMNVQLRWAAAVVAVTDGLSQLCRTITGPEKEIVIIPNGANTDMFTPDAAHLENAFTHDLPERFMIFFGTMAPWQGIGSVLAALEHPDWPADVDCLFAGDGVARPDVEAVAARLSHARYLGRLPYDALPAVVARALGGFVVPENLKGRADTGLAPLKLFETMASGIPAVVSEQPFQADLVRTKQCGHIVTPGSAAEIAQSVAALAADEGAGRAMGVRARDSVVGEHSWAVRAKATHDLLLGILRRKGR